MIKRSVKQEDKTILNIYIYIPNIRASKYIKQTLADLTVAIDSNTMIIGDLNNPLSITDRLPRQKITKKTGLEHH